METTGTQAAEKPVRAIGFQAGSDPGPTRTRSVQLCADACGWSVEVCGLREGGDVSSVIPIRLMASNGKRAYGSGSIFVRSGAFYGKWWVNGRQVKRKLGPCR